MKTLDGYFIYHLPLKAKRITVLINQSGTDTVMITLDEETPFPVMKYDGIAKIEVAAGYGLEWALKVLGFTRDLIEVIDCEGKV